MTVLHQGREKEHNRGGVIEHGCDSQEYKFPAAAALVLQHVVTKAVTRTKPAPAPRLRAPSLVCILQRIRSKAAKELQAAADVKEQEQHACMAAGMSSTAMTSCHC
jgi:hypothetical protein